MPPTTQTISTHYKAENRLFLYQLRKIISYIKKITLLSKKEGIQPSQVTSKIIKALQIKRVGQCEQSLLSYQSGYIQKYLTKMLTESRNSFTVSALKNLYQVYDSLRQNLNQSLQEDESQSHMCNQSVDIQFQQLEHSIKMEKAILGQIKLQQQEIQPKQESKCNRNSSQQLSRKEIVKEKIIKYLEAKIRKLGKKKSEPKHSLESDEQCTRKYGSKTQMERHNYEQFEEVKRLRQKVFGNKFIQLFRRTRSSIDKFHETDSSVSNKKRSTA